MAQTATEARKQQLGQEHQSSLIARAVAVLEATGCRFKVIAPDGAEHGALEVVREKTITRVKVFKFQEDTKYIDAIKSIHEGRSIAELVPIPPEHADNKDYVEGLIKCIRAKARQLLGDGNFSTELVRSTDTNEHWVEIKKTFGLPE